MRFSIFVCAAVEPFVWQRGGAEFARLVHPTIDHGRSDELGSGPNWKKNARFKKLVISSFSGANWKSKFIRVSRDL